MSLSVLLSVSSYMSIMEEMLAELPSPRPELSPYAPRIITLHIDPDKIRIVIGPGGKTVQNIVDETGVKVDIEDDGTIYIASVDEDSAAQAVKIPIIGMGGIASAEDAVEFMLAGASAVAVGAMNFHDPYLTQKVVDGMEQYLIRHNIQTVRELTGAVQ